MVERALAELAGHAGSARVAPWRPGDVEIHDVLINATPLGMRDGDPSPFDADQVHRAACVADIVADPPRTRLADHARRAGVTLITYGPTFPHVTLRDMVASQIEPIGAWLLDPGLEQ